MAGHRNTKKAKNAERGIQAASMDPELAIRRGSSVGRKYHIGYRRPAGAWPTDPYSGDLPVTEDSYRLTAFACRTLGIAKR